MGIFERGERERQTAQMKRSIGALFHPPTSELPREKKKNYIIGTRSRDVFQSEMHFLVLV